MKNNPRVQSFLLAIILVGIISLILKTQLSTPELATLSDRPLTDTPGTLVVGMELKFPPFETVDPSGNPIGVSVDFANALGDKLGYDVKIQSLDWAGLIPALQSNNIDIIISSMSITPERLESIDFSDEYAKSDIALAVHTDSGITDYAMLDDASYTVAVKQGTIGEMWATSNLTQATIKPFSEVSAAMLDVNNGQSSAFIYDPLTLIEGSQNLSQITLLLQPLPGTQGWGIGIQKGHTALRDALNTALTELKTEGFFDVMREKYLKEEVEKYESYGLDYFF